MPEVFSPSFRGVTPKVLDRVLLASTEEGDWYRAWVDNKLVYEGHEGWSPLLEAVVTALGAGHIVRTTISDD